MLEQLFNNFQPIKCLVFLTFFIGCYNLKKIKKNILLISVLFVCFISEFGVYFLKDIVLFYSVSFIFHNFLWLYMISKYYYKNYINKAILIFFILFSFYNLFFIEGISKLNYNIFILGAFFYVLGFLFLSFKELKNENFSFFYSHHYLLIFSPIIFFLGYSLMFGFGDNKLMATKLIGDFELYDFISYFSNVIYYSLIIFYILREKNEC